MITKDPNMKWNRENKELTIQEAKAEEIARLILQFKHILNRIEQQVCLRDRRKRPRTLTVFNPHSGSETGYRDIYSALSTISRLNI